MVRIILTLLISAAIGYATNYLAVKMLFRPLEPVYIKGHRLPFTPGIIPKGKPRLAKALSAAVSDSLLTSEDIENAVLSDKSKKLCAEKLCMGLYMRERNKLGQMLQDLSQGCTYSTARQKLKEHIVEKGTQAALDMNAGKMMIDEITAAVKEKTQGSMAAMFITDELISELTKPAADKLEEYIREKAPEMIEQAAEKELCEIEDKTIPQVFTELYLFENSIPALTLPAGTKLEGECGDGLMDEGRHPLQQIIHDATVTDNGDGTWRFDLHALSNDLNPAKVSIDVQGLVTEYDSTTGIVTFSAEPKNFTYEYDIEDCGRFAYKMPVLVCFNTAGEGVAQVGDTVYDTFAAAAAAANNGEQVITLLANIVEPYTMSAREILRVNVGQCRLDVQRPAWATNSSLLETTTDGDITTYFLHSGDLNTGDGHEQQYTTLQYYADGWIVLDNYDSSRPVYVTASDFEQVINDNMTVTMFAVPSDEDPMWQVLFDNLGTAETIGKIGGFDFQGPGDFIINVPEGKVLGTCDVRDPQANVTIVQSNLATHQVLHVYAGSVTYYGNVSELSLHGQQYNYQTANNGARVTIYGDIWLVDWAGKTSADLNNFAPYYGSLYVSGSIGREGTTDIGQERGTVHLDLQEQHIGVIDMSLPVNTFMKTATDAPVCVIEDGELQTNEASLMVAPVDVRIDDLVFEYQYNDGSWRVDVRHKDINGSLAIVWLPDDFTVDMVVSGENNRLAVYRTAPDTTLVVTAKLLNVHIFDNSNVTLDVNSEVEWVDLYTQYHWNPTQDNCFSSHVNLNGQVGYVSMSGPMSQVTLTTGESFSAENSVVTWDTYAFGRYYENNARFFTAGPGKTLFLDGALKIMSYDTSDFGNALGAIMTDTNTLKQAAGDQLDEGENAFMFITTSSTEEAEATLAVAQINTDDVEAVFQVDVAATVLDGDHSVIDSKDITTLSQPVTFVLELPEDADSNIYEVIRLQEEGGGIEATTVTTSAIGEDTVTVSSNKFSVYLLRRIVPVASFVVDEETGVASATIGNAAFQSGEDAEAVVVAPAEGSVITVTFDETAAAAIADNVETLDDTVGIILNVEKIDEEVNEGAVVSVTYDITMVTTTGEEVFSDSNAEGTAVVTVPFPVGDGNAPLVYLVTDGVQTPIQVIGHTAETVTFVARHFSVYKVVSVDDTPVTVTFDLNGGWIGDSTENITVNVTPGQMIGDQKPADPTKDGYAFVEWQLNGEAYDFETPVTADMTLTAQWTAAVASITKNGTTTYYATLKAAVDAVQDGDTITLLADVTGEFEVAAGKAVVLDLNGKTITSVGDTLTVRGTLTVNDSSKTEQTAGTGKIIGKWPVNVVGGTLIFNEGIVEAQDMAGWFADGSTVTINGGTFTSADNAVLGTPGNAGRGGNTITINGGTFNGNITTSGYIACGIYAANNDTWNIAGGAFNITGGAGIVVRAGKVNLTGGAITTSGSTTGKVGDAGNAVPCSAIVLDVKAGYPGAAGTDQITIGNATLTTVDGVEAIAVLEGDGHSYVDGSITAAGNTLTVPADYKWVAKGTDPETYDLVKVAVSGLKAIGAALALEGRIIIRIGTEPIENSTIEYVTLTINGRTRKVAFNEADINSGNTKLFNMPVYAKEMDDNVVLKAFDANDNQLKILRMENGEWIEVDEYTYSVKRYIANTPANANYKKLVDTMGVYGDYAKYYFQNPHGTTSMPDGYPLTPISASDLNAYAAVTNGSLGNVKYAGGALALEDGTYIRVFFTGDVDGYTFSCNGVELEPVAYSSYHYVTIDNIAAKELDTVYTVEVTDGTNTYSVRYSALTYVRSVLSNNSNPQTLKDVVTALYWYNQEANEYFPNNN